MSQKIIKLFQCCHNWSPYTQSRRLDDDEVIEMKILNDSSGSEKLTTKDNDDEVDAPKVVNNEASSSRNLGICNGQDNDKIEIEVKPEKGHTPLRRVGLAKSGQAMDNQNSTSDKTFGSSFSQRLQRPGAKVSNVKIQVADDYQGPNLAANQVPNIQRPKPKTPQLRRQNASESGEMRTVEIKQVDVGLETNHLF